MSDLISFFIVLVAGVFFSLLFNRLHLPWVIALILGGIIIGPFGFGLFSPSPALELMSQIGLVFLMFMAGLETRMKTVLELRDSVIPLTILSCTVPLAIGAAIGLGFGLSLEASLLLGIIFASSSIAVIIPSLEESGIIESKIGRTLVVSTILIDIFSLALFSIVLQSINQTSILPLPFFYAFLVSLFVVLRLLIPSVKRRLTFRSKKDLFESEIRQVFVILIGVVVLFEIIGLHPIIAGFFAGMVLSDTITNDLIREKIHTLGYGIFIPVFFITIGTQANMRSLFESGETVTLAAIVIAGALFTKLASGYLGGRLSKFSAKESLFIGAATIPHLSTALAVIFAGFTLNIFPETLVAALIALTLITSFVGPFAIARLAPIAK
jgi:Kef-type K+ transport system membrane component KefB